MTAIKFCRGSNASFVILSLPVLDHSKIADYFKQSSHCLRRKLRIARCLGKPLRGALADQFSHSLYGIRKGLLHFGESRSVFSLAPHESYELMGEAGMEY